MIWRSSMEARRWRSPPPSKALPFFIPMAATRCGCQLDARVESLITAGDCPFRVGSRQPMTAGGSGWPRTNSGPLSVEDCLLLYFGRQRSVRSAYCWVK